MSHSCRAITVVLFASAEAARLGMGVSVKLRPNRLIGDAALPPAQRLTRTNVAFGKGTPLLVSGLLKPVRILVEN